jgi:hypothetical protein
MILKGETTDYADYTDFFNSVSSVSFLVPAHPVKIGRSITVAVVLIKQRAYFRPISQKAHQYATSPVFKDVFDLLPMSILKIDLTK